MTFNTGGYTITGQTIQLGNPNTDIIQISGQNLLQTPLQLDASSVDVQAGVLDLQGTVSGTAGLTKLGSGTLILTGPSTFTGGTLVQAGTLQVDGDYSRQLLNLRVMPPRSSPVTAASPAACPSPECSIPDRSPERQRPSVTCRSGPST
jgi:autotransporter-associated beta strand protein